MSNRRAMRDKPPLFKQPFGSAKCWAYALSMWMKVSGRPPTTPAAIMAACSNFMDPVSGALIPTKFPDVAESRFVNMGWKVIPSGKSVDWDEMVDLLKVGWLYVILDSSQRSALDSATGTHFSHARVVYGVNASDGARTMSAMDSILGDIEWLESDIVINRLMLGFDRDLLITDEVPDRHQWLAKAPDGAQQRRWCPKS